MINHQPAGETITKNLLWVVVLIVVIVVFYDYDATVINWSNADYCVHNVSPQITCHKTYRILP